MQRSTLRTIILVTGIITAAIHLVLLNIPFIQSTGRPDVLFTLNGLGFIAFLAAIFLNLPVFSQRKKLIQYAFMGYTALTILAWIPGGARNIVGYATKLDELILLTALWMYTRGIEPE